MHFKSWIKEIENIYVEFEKNELSNSKYFDIIKWVNRIEIEVDWKCHISHNKLKRNYAFPEASCYIAI